MLAAGALAIGCANNPKRRSSGDRSIRSIRAVACDAFVLFDPRPFAATLEQMFPGRGAAIAAGFRGRLFDYGWLRALGDRYRDFWLLSEDALDATADAEQLELAPSQRAALLDVWASLPPWLRSECPTVSATSRRGWVRRAKASWKRPSSVRSRGRALARSRPSSTLSDCIASPSPRSSTT